MNSKKIGQKDKFKKISAIGCTSLLAFSAFTLCAPAIYAPAHVYASQYSEFEKVTITNGDFNETSTSSYPKTASSWDILTSNSGIKAGVISTMDSQVSAYYKDYGLFKSVNIISDDDASSPNTFMMNAMRDKAIYGIQSAEFELDSNSCYVVSFNVRTNLEILEDEAGVAIESCASAYLMIDGKQVMSKVAINTQNNWTTYYFFFQTSFESSSKANVQFYLGSKEFASAGAVLFDSVNCTKYSKGSYATKKASVQNQFKAVDADSNPEYISDTSLADPTYNAKVNVTDTMLDDPSFQDATKWTKADYGSISNINSGIIDADSKYINGDYLITEPKTNNFATDNKVLAMAIEYDKDQGASVTYTSEAFTIKRYSNYLIQFYVKTSDLQGDGLHASVIPTDSKNTAVTLNSITASSSAITNDWTQCSIYVQGSSFEDIEVKLEFGLGNVKSKSTAGGLAFIDDISIYKISYEKYNGVTTSSTIGQGSVAPSSSTTSDSKISNANFDTVSTTAGDEEPFAPASWEAGNANNTTSGIINNKYYAGTKYGLSWSAIGLTTGQSFIDEAIAEELATANQNLLMIRTDDEGYQSYTSTSVELTKSTLYKLSIDAKALISDSAYIKVKLGDDIIYNQTISTSTSFNLYDMYFITPMATTSITVELGVGSQDNLCCYAYAFFDNIYLTDLTDSNDTDYTPEKKLKELQEDNADLVSINLNSGFLEYDGTSVNGTGLYTPYSWSISEQTGINAGIDAANNCLTIASTNPNTDYTVQSKYTYEINQAKYYKVEFNFITSGFENLTESQNGIKLGFTEKSASGEYFENIVSADETTYTFYIKGSDFSSLTPYISLITTNATSQQYVQLLGLDISETTEAVFKAKQQELEDDDSITNVILLGATEENEESEDSSTSNNNADIAIWSWVIPTITTCLAIVLAIIGFIVKKINRKVNKRGKKYKNDYDRENTIHKSIIDKEVEKLRQQKIEQVKSKLLATQEKLQTLEDDYKDKIADESVNKEAEYKKLVRNRKKHAQKEVELKEELEYLQSDDYTDVAKTEVLNKSIEQYEQDSVIEKTDIVEEVVDNEQETNEVVIEDETPIEDNQQQEETPTPDNNEENKEE